MKQLLQCFADFITEESKRIYSFDMIYMINSFEFQKTSVSFSLKTNCKPKSRKKLEKTMTLIQIASDTLNQWLLHVCMEITKHFIYQPQV